jgi:hypothetical protein
MRSRNLLHLAQGGPASCEKAKAMATTRIAELQHRIEELVGMRDGSPAWSIPVISGAPSVTARSCGTSKPPPPQQGPPPSGDRYAY